MAYAQKSDFVFPRKGRVHLNRWWRQFSRLLAAEVCASAWVMLDRPRSELAWEYWLPTPFTSFPFTSTAVRHRVPSGSERTLPKNMPTKTTNTYQHQHTHKRQKQTLPIIISPDSWLVPVVVTIVCVLLMMGVGDTPKHVEWLGSKTNKECLELHLVGLLSTLVSITLMSCGIWRTANW